MAKKKCFTAPSNTKRILKQVNAFVNILIYYYIIIYFVLGLI